MLRFTFLERFGSLNAGILVKEDLPSIYFSDEGLNSEKILCVLNKNHIYPSAICRVKQEHSDKIHVLKGEEDIKIVSADGLITQNREWALCISIADCAPVFLYDHQRHIIGVIHAGREGTRKKIIDRALDIFVHEFHTNKEDIVALVGPSIGPCCYYLPQEMLRFYFNEGLIITGHGTLDLWSSIKKQLVEKGINEKNIHCVNECTCCNNHIYYSYRKGDKTSRNYAIAMIKNY